MSAPETRDERVTVLYVIWSLQMGGAERVVFDLARSIDRTRFRPVVACLNFKGALAEPLLAEGIPVYALDKKPKLDLGVLFRLARLMREEHVDIVHTHLWTSSFWGRLAAVLARVPVVVVTEHNLDLWRRTPHFVADRLLGRATDDWIFVSKEVEAFYRERLRIPADRGHVVLNGVDTKPFATPLDRADVRRRMGVDPEARVAGVVGRLEARKGHRFFLEAMKIVAGRDLGARGLIVGEGKEKAALLAQNQALGLDDTVRILGFWPDLAEALCAVDVFVLPSLMEGHPLAVLEAMAAGKPVVATDVGGNSEAVEAGDTGLLVPAENPAALADAVEALLADPKKAQAMGIAGRKSLDRRFSLDAAVAANEQTYRTCYRRNTGRTIAG